MCGICCRLRKIRKNDKKVTEFEIDQLTYELLHNRGPNAQSEVKIETDDYQFLFSGFVLWQQGDNLCQQPHLFQHHVLLINGDIFTKRDDNTISDTEWLMQCIDNCNDDQNKLLNLFRDLEGPYSVLYFNRNTEDLYFIRDVLGRQSLLVAECGDGDLTFGSVLGSPKQQYTKCIEIPPFGIYHFNLSSQEIHLNPWHQWDDSKLEQIRGLEGILGNNIIIEPSINSPWLCKHMSSYAFNLEEILRDFVNQKPHKIFEHLLKQQNILNVCDELLDNLRKSLFDRINSTPSYCRSCMPSRNDDCDHARIGILFSGGIDCTILALLTDQLIDQNQPIDLINVSFEKVRSVNKPPIDYNTPDRISAKESLVELQHLCPTRKWNLIEVDVTRTELNDALKRRIAHLVYPLISVLDESLGAVLWFGARGVGKINDVDYTSTCRVLLIGSGADELFGGYTRHRNAFIRCNTPELTPYERLENELEFDFKRLPSRNLARDDRIIGDFGTTARSPYVEEHFVRFVRSLKANQKCFHLLEQGVGDKLLLRLCGYCLGLREVTSLKKRAMQFGSRVADAKQNAKDVSKSLMQ